MANQSEVKRAISFRMAVIGLLAILLVAFALMNLQTVPVHPFGDKPVIMVILISFLLGALIGFLARRPLSAKKDGA